MSELRTKGRRNTLTMAGLSLGVLALGAPVVAPPRPLLVWNASASAPIGLYSVGSGAVGRGDMVVVRVPLEVRALVVERHYLPAGVPLVKRVAAVAGDTVCAHGSAIAIGGRRGAVRLERDGEGRPLPWWHGCRTLPKGWLFLLIADSPKSFDGRYFGPSKRSDIVGKASLLWRR